MTVRSKQGDQEFRNEPSSEGSEESKDFGMARGEAFAKVGCQVRDLPIERPIVGKSLSTMGKLGYQSTCGIYLCRLEEVLSDPRVILVLKA